MLDAHDGSGEPVSLVHADDPSLARMAALDVVINNADRKGGHVLADGSGGLYGVDHGLTFNLDEKLRTVLWGWAGGPLAEEVGEVVGRLAHDLAAWCERRARTSDGGAGSWVDELADLIDADEIAATARRARVLARRGHYPHQVDGWPAIPWPPF